MLRDQLENIKIRILENALVIGEDYNIEVLDIEEHGILREYIAKYYSRVDNFLIFKQQQVGYDIGLNFNARKYGVQWRFK